MDASVHTKSSVLSLIGEHRDRFRALGVIRIGLFGSFVREEQSQESDLDLLVEFEQGRKTFDNVIRLPFRRTFSGSFRRRPVDRTDWRIGNPVH